jgi:hypothetical protein
MSEYPSLASARGKLGAAMRHKGPSSPEAAAARAQLEADLAADRAARRKAVQSDPELREIKISEVIKREAAMDPPLSPDVRARLAALLIGGTASSGHQEAAHH